MKKLLILIMTILYGISYAQDTTTITYPHYLMENGKKTVVFTLEQAQRIDNDRQLLAQFKQLGIDINQEDSACVRVVDAQGKEIAGLKTQIASIKSLGITKDTEITNLKAQIAEYIVKDGLNKIELSKKDTIIAEKNHQIRKQKTQKIVGFIGAVAAALAFLYVVIHG